MLLTRVQPHVICIVSRLLLSKVTINFTDLPWSNKSSEVHSCSDFNPSFCTFYTQRQFEVLQKLHKRSRTQPIIIKKKQKKHLPSDTLHSMLSSASSLPAFRNSPPSTSSSSTTLIQDEISQQLQSDTTEYRSQHVRSFCSYAYDR